MKNEFNERFLTLEYIVLRNEFKHEDVYKNSSKEQRRAKIADKVIGEIATVPSGRLVSLIN